MPFGFEILFNSLIHIACIAGVLVLFVPYMIMFGMRMKEKYKAPSDVNVAKAKLNKMAIGSIVAFLISIAVFSVFFVGNSNDVYYNHSHYVECDYCKEYYNDKHYDDYHNEDGIYFGYCSDDCMYYYEESCYCYSGVGSVPRISCYDETSCEYCFDYFDDGFERYHYAFAQWLYGIFRIFCVLLMSLSMIISKHKYGIKSTKFIPAIICFAFSIILSSFFTGNWIVMLIFAVCSIVCFVLAIVFYILAIKKQCKIIVNGTN